MFLAYIIASFLLGATFLHLLTGKGASVVIIKGSLYAYLLWTGALIVGQVLIRIDHSALRLF